MGLEDLPIDFTEWLTARELHLARDLNNSEYTLDLFKQYRKHLGAARYRMLIEAQKLVVPSRVSSLLGFSGLHWMRPLVPVYRLSRKMKLDDLIKDLLLPSAYKTQIKSLDISAP
jgi:hypothetical protein